jgi:hypothetical protein
MKITKYCTVKKEDRTIIVYYEDAPNLEKGAFRSIKMNYKPECQDCNIDNCPLYENAPQYQ